MSKTENKRSKLWYSVENFLSRTQRLFLGCFILVLVDIISVIFNEITKKFYLDSKYNVFEKPFFTTYFKSSLFMIYLLKFVYCSPWKTCTQHPKDYMSVNQEGDEDLYFDDAPNGLSDATFVPLSYSGRSSGTESETEHTMKKCVRFSKLAEVRHMSDDDANSALLARLSYQATLQANEFTFIQATKYNVPQVAKLAFIFSLLWFASEYSFQAALVGQEIGIVTVICSSSSAFTLVLSALFPVNSGDRISVTKCICVIISICGMILVTISDLYMEHMRIPSGALLSLVSAVFYSLYTVFLRRQAESEDKIDIPLFLGFVGLFNVLLLWPMFGVLHYNKWESFSLPDRNQWCILILNGLVGTVFCETLWLWGVFLTSSLIATLSLSLTLPLTMLVDISLFHISYPNLFFIGTFPIFLSFVIVVWLTQTNKDPMLEILIHCINICLPHPRISKRLSEADNEQSESLISINMSDQELDHEA